MELYFENGKLKGWGVKKVKGRADLPEKDLKGAMRFVKKYYEGTVSKWTDFFNKTRK